MAKPYASVLIDTYNHERFVEEAIVSALEQDFPPSEREILVVDDGSTDCTPEIVRKFEPRVRLLRKPNGGQASAFNAGIPECRGEIVAFLDGDDWWKGDKLGRVVAVLSANPSCGVVGHGIVNAFADGTTMIDAPRKPERFRLSSLANARVFRLRKSYIGTSRMTIRTPLARQILPIPAALLIEADEYLFTVAACLSDLAVWPDVLTFYRQHGENLYNAAGRNPANLRRKLRVLLALTAALREKLHQIGCPDDAARCVCEILDIEAEQMRLMLDGGPPWRTVRVESAIYRIMHADAPLSHRIFRAATMVPCFVLPPRWFYSIRGWLGQRNSYQSFRKRILPRPGVTSVAGPEEYQA